MKKKEENHGHVFETCEEIPSTCLVSGVKIEKCKTCGVTSAKEIVKAHIFGDYRVTRQATIRLNKTSITLKTGQSTTSVKVSGLTAGKKTGTAKITVKAGKKKAVVTVKVK